MHSWTPIFDRHEKRIINNLEGKRNHKLGAFIKNNYVTHEVKVTFAHNLRKKENSA